MTDKWHDRQARVIAEEEGISYEVALSRITGEPPAVKVSARKPKELPPAPERGTLLADAGGA